MDNFIQEVREQELIKEFDARLWGSRRYPGDLQGRDGNQSISRKKGLRQRIQEETQDSLPYF